MRKATIFVSILLFSVFIFACSGDETSSTMTDAEIVANSIIDFPSCISSYGETSKAVKTTSSSENSEVTQIYEGIRENIGAIEEWTVIIKSLVAEIFELTGNNPSGSWSNDYPSSGEPSKIVWGTSDREEYETMIELYWFVNEVDTLGFQAYITINNENRTAKGEFIWDFSIVPDSQNPNNKAVLKIVFDGTTDPKFLMIQAVGIDNSTNSDEPENAWVEASLGSDHIFKMSGNYYFEDIKIFDEASAGEERNYVFIVIGYDDYPVSRPANSTDNKAILQLALPTSNVGSLPGWEEDMWDDDSIGNIYCTAVINSLGADLDTFIAWYNGETDPDITNNHTNITNEEFITILEYAAADGSNAGLNELIFVLNLVNPAYFNAYGFLGTWDGTRGTLESMPTGYEGLDILSVQAIKPFEVRDLEIPFYDL